MVINHLIQNVYKTLEYYNFPSSTSRKSRSLTRALCRQVQILEQIIGIIMCYHSLCWLLTCADALPRWPKGVQAAPKTFPQPSPDTSSSLPKVPNNFKLCPRCQSKCPPAPTVQGADPRRFCSYIAIICSYMNYIAWSYMTLHDITRYHATLYCLTWH